MRSWSQCPLSCFSCVQLLVTLWTLAHQGPLSMGILQARILEWVAVSSSKGSSQPRDPVQFFCMSCIDWGILYHQHHLEVQFLSVSQSCLLFETPWTTAHQTSLSITNSHSLLKLMSIELVMPSNHLILCRPILLLSSILPSIRLFSNKSL